MATKRYDFKFHCTRDAEVIARLDSKENKQQYIRSLILSDIAADGLLGLLQFKDQDADEIRKAELLRKACRATDPDLEDPSTACDGCKYQYLKDPYYDVQGCMLEGLNADEMDDIINGKAYPDREREPDPDDDTGIQAADESW